MEEAVLPGKLNKGARGPERPGGPADPRLWAQEKEGLWSSPSPLPSIKGKAALGWGPAKGGEGSSPMHPQSPLQGYVWVASRIWADFGVRAHRDFLAARTGPPKCRGHRHPQDTRGPGRTLTFPLCHEAGSTLFL